MTAAQMNRTVRQARRYGYYLSGTMLWNYCPLCHARVETPRQHGPVNPQLDAAMVDHLKYEHAES